MPYEELSILFLCRKYYYLHKMSRVRFHAVQAISRVSKVLWSGPGWENWQDALSVKENIARLYQNSPSPDMVLCYKVDELRGLGEISQPACVNRDELDTEDNTALESIRKFTQAKIDLVISHQIRQMENPAFQHLPCRFVHIPYSVNDAIFKDYGQEKNIDLLLVGNLANTRYPLRSKLSFYLTEMQKEKRFQHLHLAVYPYPGYRLKTAYDDAHVIEFAKWINRSKICLTCSGKYHLKYAKYVEIPACRSLLMADMPHEDQEILRHYLAEISEGISYGDFIKKVQYYLEEKDIRESLISEGFKIVHQDFTQTQYAEKFIAAVKNYLNDYGRKKVWITMSKDN